MVLLRCGDAPGATRKVRYRPPTAIHYRECATRATMEGMPAARPLPTTGSIYLDSRGTGRALRLSWHHEAGCVVLSLWRDNVCSGSFRLAVDDVPDMIDALRSGLDAAYRHAPTRSAATPPATRQTA